MKNPTQFDRLATSVPVDRTAAAAVSTGTHYQAPDHLFTEQPVSFERPKILPITKAIQQSRGFVDLSRQRFGRLTAVGMAADHPKRWVVLCLCGRYQYQSARALKNGLATMCCVCYYLDRVTRSGLGAGRCVVCGGLCWQRGMCRKCSEGSTGEDVA